MKKIIQEFQFTPEEGQRVKELARVIGLTETTAGILYARGIDTEEAMRRFLAPSKEHFLPPLLMSGMKEAVSLITQARDEEWRVAVFGDYDADGIGACAVISRALKQFGIEPYLYIPERTEGYGMNNAAIDKIFDEFLPDLIITVDCGISNAETVEYIKEQGAYVIVTDHHELPERLPDCICINPKIADDYPYDNLCGAGVAFKLAQALIGDDALRLLDFAALSTVADSVPLLGENRDIVAEGLRLLQHDPRPAFAALLEKASGEVNATTLAFTVAPRINAAGRMGDAHCALSLFTSENEAEIYDLAAKLNAYNMERQRCCSELYAQAAAQVKRQGAYGNLIMLQGDGWNTGFVGIVAAQIAEEYSRPAILFVRKGDMLKGSARSVENVNLFDALKACSQYIEEFGGHAQAAGVNVRADNFDKLYAALDRYLGERYSREDFLPKIRVCGEWKGENAMRLARELNMLEPYGMGNRRPMFTFTAEKLNAAPIKPMSPHVSFSERGMEFMYFSGAPALRLLKSDLKKTVVFEYNLSRFRGREYLKGFVRTVLYDGMSGTETERDCFENSLRVLCAQPRENVHYSDTQAVNALLTDRISSCAYGLCAVAFDKNTLSRYPVLEGLDVDVFTLSSGSVQNTVLLYPAAGCDLSAYRDIVFLDTPPAVSVLSGNAEVYLNRELCGYGKLYGLSPVREELLSVFAAIRNRDDLAGDTVTEIARGCDSLGFAEEQFVFALSVFEELGLIAIEGGRLKLFRGKKTELTNSTIYNAVTGLLERE